MNLNQYCQILNTRYQTGISRELTYRGDLQTLLSTLLPDVLVTNEPARIACGAPDYILTKKDIPVGYIEAKDIGNDLNNKAFKEQFDRYRASLNNLIFTDYLDFHFYKDGNFVTKIAIAEIQNGKIVALPGNFDTFTGLVKNFAATISQSIKSPTKLAEMMAGRAKMMADVIEKSLNEDDKQENNSALKGQMQTFKTVLIHDITNRAFADLYAQTIAYGMFAARYHDPTLPTFSRQEAATLIPKTNPFLRRLFQDIAGFDLDDRLVWIVDELVQIFLASDVAEIMRNFGTRTKQEDPVIHFYETFLAAYDPALRKARGVWYTPEPVVNFIVRAVDDILQTEFGLSQGLADTSKIKIKKKVVAKATADARSKVKEVEIEQDVHRVQILDPATGTGTFLAEVVRQIYQKFEGQKGIWSKYVENNLIPRLNGFEILMASYAMAHLKLDLLLTETGFKPTKDQRFRVYLTNSLEESHPDAGTLFSHWLSDEANEANNVKRDAPVMVVLGNPPYSGESSNKGTWIRNLVNDSYLYKNGKRLVEKGKKNWLQDDYVKFIRYGQSFIEKNGEGILAYVCNNSFLDNPTFRYMRWNLLQTFDSIYVIDLHGSAKKNNTTLDGKSDKNVFDIQQGVSINIFIRKKTRNQQANIFYFDVWGSREEKYKFLLNNRLDTVKFSKLSCVEPYYFFIPKEYKGSENYRMGFSISELFTINGAGIISGRDKFIISESLDTLKSNLSDFANLNISNEDIRQKYDIEDNSMWKMEKARIKFSKTWPNESLFHKMNYRPFDSRWTYYQTDILFNMRVNTMKNFLIEGNIGLVTNRLVLNEFTHSWITKEIINDCLISNKTKERSYVFPLYILPETTTQTTLSEAGRTPNLNVAIVQQIAQKIGLRFTNEKETDTDTFAPIDILDYIYAVLHSPKYRETYKEFLKMDFPRVPYPKDAATFWALVTLGGKIRKTHLLEDLPTLASLLTTYPEDGDNVVRKIRYENESVYINETQYFSNVPAIAWELYIGGYQPAQKWLKDRVGKELNTDDVFHYRHIIASLVKTYYYMIKVDEIEVL
jgi:predicted helicase